MSYQTPTSSSKMSPAMKYGIGFIVSLVLAGMVYLLVKHFNKSSSSSSSSSTTNDKEDNKSDRIFKFLSNFRKRERLSAEYENDIVSKIKSFLTIFKINQPACSMKNAATNVAFLTCVIKSPDNDLDTKLASFLLLARLRGGDSFVYNETDKTVTFMAVSEFGPSGTNLSVDELRSKLNSMTQLLKGESPSYCKPDAICDYMATVS